MSDLLFTPATELAELVRSGELAARELVEASLRRIDELEPSINAFTHVAHDSAQAEAARVRPGDPRPFAGVPIAIKDNRAVAGMPLTMCSDLFGDLVADHDAYLVRRFRDAGFVIVGKTKLPEMGILPTTESRRFGPTHNPWALDRTPGGSSGGSGAAVAAGMVPLAHGNDGGGSIRIPAACCGLVGLKAGAGARLGRTRRRRELPGGRRRADAHGRRHRRRAGRARRPGDRRRELGAAGPTGPSPSTAAARAPGRLKIGLALNSPLEGAELDPVCEAAARDAAALLESLGHEVEEISRPGARLDLLPDFTPRVRASLISMTTSVGGRLAGREPTADDVEPLTLGDVGERAMFANMDAIELRGVAEARLETVARGVVAVLGPDL